MAGGPNYIVTVMNVDVVPTNEVIGDRSIRLGVGALHVGDRGITEDNPETKRVVGKVPLEHDDLMRGIRPFHENRKVQP